MGQAFYLPDQKSISVKSGQTLLEAALGAQVPHVHACGGQARCSTCRVMVIKGLEHCRPRNESETAIAERLQLSPHIRLACQTKITDSVEIRRLIIDDLDSALMRESLEKGRQGEERCLAILFADIRGFTSFTETLPGYDVVHVLNRYFFRMGEVINSFHGRVNNVMGDGFLALFGIEKTEEDPVWLAVQAALRMKSEMDVLRQYYQRIYQKCFELSVGIHYGEVILGEMGPSGEQRLTVIGDAVNQASRVEEMTREVESSLLLSEDAYHRVQERVVSRLLGEYPLKGKQGHYNLYSLETLKEASDAK